MVTSALGGKYVSASGEKSQRFIKETRVIWEDFTNEGHHYRKKKSPGQQSSLYGTSWHNKSRRESLSRFKFKFGNSKSDHVVVHQYHVPPQSSSNQIIIVL